MKQVLTKIGYTIENITFRDLFDERLWKKILDYYWKVLVVDKNRFLFSMVSNVDLLLDKLLLNSPNIKQNETLKLIGMYYLAKEKGLVEMRKIYEKKLKIKNWSKFSKDFEILNQITEIKDCFGWFGEIDKVLRFDKLISKDMN